MNMFQQGDQKGESPPTHHQLLPILITSPRTT